MKALLRGISGPANGLQVELDTRLVTSVGRNATCTFPLMSDRFLSGHHFEIAASGEQMFLRDLGSSNGTFLNGHPLKTVSRLGDTDQLRFGTNGPTVEVRLVSEKTPDQPLGALKKAETPSTGPQGVRATGGSSVPSTLPPVNRGSGGSTTQRIPW